MPKRRKMDQRYVSEEAEHGDSAEIDDNGSEDAEMDLIVNDQCQDDNQTNKNDCASENESDAESEDQDEDQDEEYESDFIDDDNTEKYKIAIYSEFADDDDYSRSGSQSSQELTMSQELDNLD